MFSLAIFSYIFFVLQGDRNIEEGYIKKGEETTDCVRATNGCPESKAHPKWRRRQKINQFCKIDYFIIE